MALSAMALIAMAAVVGPQRAAPVAEGAALTALAACTAPAPERGAAFSGPVLQVIDGRTFCVAQGPTPSSWVKVTLAGRADGGGRSNLMAAAFARRVTCVADGPTQDGVLARCAVDAAATNTAAVSGTSGAGATTCLKPD